MSDGAPKRLLHPETLAIRTQAARTPEREHSVPAGRYTLVAWHPRLGRVEQPVTVTAGQAVTAVVTLGR